MLPRENNPVGKLHFVRFGLAELDNGSLLPLLSDTAVFLNQLPVQHVGHIKPHHPARIVLPCRLTIVGDNHITLEIDHFQNHALIDNQSVALLLYFHDNAPTHGLNPAIFFQHVELQIIYGLMRSELQGRRQGRCSKSQHNNADDSPDKNFPFH